MIAVKIDNLIISGDMNLFLLFLFTTFQYITNLISIQTQVISVLNMILLHLKRCTKQNKKLALRQSFPLFKRISIFTRMSRERDAKKNNITTIILPSQRKQNVIKNYEHSLVISRPNRTS